MRQAAARVRTAQSEPHPWRLWADTGGTFTDCIAISPEGEVRRAKVLSSGVVLGRTGNTSAETNPTSSERESIGSRPSFHCLCRPSG